MRKKILKRKVSRIGWTKDGWHYWFGFLEYSPHVRIPEIHRRSGNASPPIPDWLGKNPKLVKITIEEI